MVFDYFFLTEKDNPGETNPMLIMKDEQTGEVYARMVEHKGLREGEDGTWIVSDIIAELKSWGHQGGEAGNVILKCDGEKSISAVIEEVAKRLGGKVMVEKVPKRRVTEQWSRGGGRKVGKGNGQGLQERDRGEHQG